ncbi:DEAD/DEAH box helicase [Corallococcus carmarthensis]|uniref:DEAD/DEAH box helicase n=1 Tax=Corallococcus carmarthensis TaxID=2316728 RepID=A0A3A8K7B7_9BACT|nr:DEAD/DEAH box helicase [Corallococcus carmarthensis]NOK17134.1 DEAD/DEAH box helicase [Corallococcus carmarthensis]RKH04043.1 DEAD/DEAH box helicase [Corallococcus carmarthensis]
MRTPTDRYLPPRSDVSFPVAPPRGRVVVIAPTRAACETIELALGLELRTYLEQHHGERLLELARSGQGFGIVAGTGTGKTLAIRPIAEEIVGRRPLRIAVVNREREASAETQLADVVIVTTGIARRWFQGGVIRREDTLIVDEIHQTSAELELCLALGKRVGCRFIWLSATVDPAFYSRYLDSADVLQVSSFDPGKAARVEVERRQPLAFLNDAFLQDVQRQGRGVGVFLATRAGVEEVAAHVRSNWPEIHAAHYHGGEPLRAIRPFLEGSAPRPFVLAMTAAGQSALNVPGLDTVVIDDMRFTNLVEGGRNVLTRVHLGSNELLQMAGRVHGRVVGGRVFILSDRSLHFASLRPTEPEFQLAGEPERVALTAAALGVRADELDLPVPLDRNAYRRALAKLQARNIVDADGRLSDYGRAVEALPVERPWAELIVNAEDGLLPFLAVCSSVESLHRMTREERNLDGVLVPGSDHLTAYNLYAEAFREAGSVGEVQGLPRHVFNAEKLTAWTEGRGVLAKALEDAALAMASVYRSVRLALPARMPFATPAVYQRFCDLLARFMPFDLVIDERTSWGEVARVSKTSVCGNLGAVAGVLRYFADRNGESQAGIEGTQLPQALLRRYARRHSEAPAYDARFRSVVLVRMLDYFGFKLEQEVDVLRAWGPELATAARHALAEALARGDAPHPAVDRHRVAIAEVRELWRRSGGLTAPLGFPELTALYEAQLDGVDTLDEFRERPLRFDLDALVPRATRQALLALPDTVEVREQGIPLEYDVELLSDGAPRGVVRLHLPEKLARTLVEEELPRLDRSQRFSVARGRRGVLQARSLLELQELLDRPWMPDEVAEATRERQPQVQDRERDAPRYGGNRSHQGKAPRNGGRRGGGGRRR